VFLKPGDFHFGDGSLRISTLLGSCVAITCWHPGLQIGGMCHYLLPRRRDSGWNGTEELDGRYADEAMKLFEQRMIATLTTPHEYQFKIFGGGHQFLLGDVGAASDVPLRNVEAGLQLLSELGVHPIARHVGGTGSRQIVMQVPTGEVWVRHTQHAEEAG
jgi:chemotaxis protein CheD